MIRQLHIGILVERRYLTQAQPVGLVAALSAKGYRAAIIVPEIHFYSVKNDNWLDGLDAIVARGRSWGLLSLLAWAETCGIPTINSRSAIAGVHNKAEMAVTLASASIPIPHTFLNVTENLASQITNESYPLILKPIFGDNCRGLQVVNAPRELSQLDWREPAALAQQYLPNDGYDLKIYGIGSEVWIVRKPSPLGIYKTRQTDGSNVKALRVEQVPTTPVFRELGRRCRAIFGLDLFGVDCVQTVDGPVVIEVNDFPNYNGVPDADEKLADFVIRKARGEKP